MFFSELMDGLIYSFELFWSVSFLKVSIKHFFNVLENLISGFRIQFILNVIGKIDLVPVCKFTRL